HRNRIRWDPACVQLGVFARHFCRCDSELAEAAGHAGRLCRHPVERIKAADFADDSAVRRQLRRVEERWGADTRPPCQCCRPEFLDTDADGRDDAEPGDDWLSLHRLALSSARRRISLEKPGIYVSRRTG